MPGLDKRRESTAECNLIFEFILHIDIVTLRATTTGNEAENKVN